MAYENDIIMRQVRDMTRMLAKILFGKNTATYEYKEEDRHTATDSLYARLIALVDAGKINEAENRLYEELERDEEGTFEVFEGGSQRRRTESCGSQGAGTSWGRT